MFICSKSKCFCLELNNNIKDCSSCKHYKSNCIFLNNKLFDLAEQLNTQAISALACHALKNKQNGLAKIFFSYLASRTDHS